jgi:hypothetical protein
MKYKKAASGTASVAVPPVSGANIAPQAAAGPPAFYSWKPSTWPTHTKFEPAFMEKLKQIFQESMLSEIANVIADIKKCNGDLQHRGHVVAISLMCALDAISSYPYRKHNMSKFVAAHFPAAYKPHANALYRLYRNSMIHSWNLFEAGIAPGTETITKGQNGTLVFGLEDFFQALNTGVEDFLEKLEANVPLQKNTLNRYNKLRKTAKA